MFNIRLNIEKIDYEQSVGALLPSLVDNITRNPSDASMRELSKLLTKLGSDTVPVAKKMLRYLRADVKDEIIVWLLTGHKINLCAEVNKYLEKIFGKGVFSVSDIIADNLPGSRMDLIASQVSVDYPSLLASPFIQDVINKLGADNALLRGAAKLAIQMGSKMPADTLEKQVLPILSQDKVKDRILSALQGGLVQAGLSVTIKDLVIEAAAAAPAKTSAQQKVSGLIPDSFEDGVIEGIALWLKSTVN